MATTTKHMWPQVAHHGHQHQNCGCRFATIATSTRYTWPRVAHHGHQQQMCGCWLPPWPPAPDTCGPDLATMATNTRSVVAGCHHGYQTPNMRGHQVSTTATDPNPQNWSYFLTTFTVAMMLPHLPPAPRPRWPWWSHGTAQGGHVSQDFIPGALPQHTGRAAEHGGREKKTPGVLEDRGGGGGG